MTSLFSTLQRYGRPSIESVLFNSFHVLVMLSVWKITESQRNNGDMTTEDPSRQGWFQIVFVFEYRNVLVLYMNWKTQACMYLYILFGLSFESICKYNHINTHRFVILIKKSISSHNLTGSKIKTECFFHTCGRAKSGQVALRMRLCVLPKRYAIILTLYGRFKLCTLNNTFSDKLPPT